MVEALAAIFGLLIGSFLNVCIYRWPRDLSVVRPRSRCPGCEKQIAWFDNIPVLSYLLLRGRCRACEKRISPRYPAVEVLTAIAFAWFVHLYGLTAAGAKFCVLAAILIGLAFSDIETRILPDEFTLGGAIAGIGFSLFVPVPGDLFAILASIAGARLPPRVVSLGESVLGAVLCSGLLWFAGWAFEKIRHKEGLGFGDVKMLVMAGAFLGTQGALQMLISGSILGSVAGLAWIKLTGKDAASYQLPFATFLAVAGMAVALFARFQPA